MSRNGNDGNNKNRPPAPLPQGVDDAQQQGATLAPASRTAEAVMDENLVIKLAADNTISVLFKGILYNDPVDVLSILNQENSRFGSNFPTEEGQYDLPFGPDLRIQSAISILETQIRIQDAKAVEKATERLEQVLSETTLDPADALWAGQQMKKVQELGSELREFLSSNGYKIVPKTKLSDLLIERENLEAGNFVTQSQSQEQVVAEPNYDVPTNTNSKNVVAENAAYDYIDSRPRAAGRKPKLWDHISYKEFSSAVNNEEYIKTVKSQLEKFPDGETSKVFDALALQIAYLREGYEVNRKRIEGKLKEVLPEYEKFKKEVEKNPDLLSSSNEHKRKFVEYNLLIAEFEKLPEIEKRITDFKDKVAELCGNKEEFLRKCLEQENKVLQKGRAIIDKEVYHTIQVLNDSSSVDEKRNRLETISKEMQKVRGELNPAQKVSEEEAKLSEIKPKDDLIVPPFIEEIKFRNENVADSPEMDPVSDEDLQAIRSFINQVAQLAVDIEGDDVSSLDPLIPLINQNFDLLSKFGINSDSLESKSSQTTEQTTDSDYEEIDAANSNGKRVSVVPNKDSYVQPTPLDPKSKFAYELLDFVEQCRGGGAQGDEIFNTKVGLFETKEGNNAIHWIDSSEVTKGYSVNVFFWQRLLIQANARSLEKEFDNVRQNQNQEDFLNSKYKQEEDKGAGLAKAVPLPQVMAMRLAFLQLKEQERHRYQEAYGETSLVSQMFDSINYQYFAVVANVIGRAKNGGNNDIAHDMKVLFGSVDGENPTDPSKEAQEVFSFFRDYIYARANQAVKYEFRVPYYSAVINSDNNVRDSLIGVLCNEDKKQLIAARIALSEGVYGVTGEDNEVINADFEGGDSIKSLYELLRNKDLATKALQYQQAISDKNQQVIEKYNSDLDFQDKLAKLKDGLNKFYEIAFDDAVRTQVQNVYDLDVSENLASIEDVNQRQEDRHSLADERDNMDEMSDTFFANRGKSVLRKAENNPPRLKDVREARLRFRESLEKDPKFLDKDARVNANHDDFSHKYSYEFKELEEDAIGDSVKKTLLKRKEIGEGEFLTEKNQGINLGDDSLFETADEVYIDHGQMVAEFDQPSCMSDFAKAVEQMPNNFAKNELAEGRMVYNVAYLSGDDGQNRKNQVALIRQTNNYDAPVVTFTTYDVLRESVYDKSVEFFEKQLRGEDRMANLQALADIATIYLNDAISRGHKDGKFDGLNTVRDFGLDEADLARKATDSVLHFPPEIRELARLNYYLQACAKKFALGENDSLEVRNQKIADLEKFMESATGMPVALENGMSNGDHIQNLPDLLEKTQQAFANIDENGSSSLAKRFSVISQQMAGQKKSLPISQDAIARAKKYSTLETNKFLSEREKAANREAELKFQLTDEDVKAMKISYYNSSMFSKKGKTEFDKLLQSKIPKSPYPGITIYKPKGKYGQQSNTAVVSFDLPSDSLKLNGFDDIAWIYLPETPECYIKARVVKVDGKQTYYKNGKKVEKECKAGEILIDEGVVYHKRDGSTYSEVQLNDKALKSEFKNASDAKYIKDLCKNFSVLATSSISGERTGVASLYKGSVVSKNENTSKKSVATSIDPRVAPEVVNPEMRRSANLECKFQIGADGRIKTYDFDAIGINKNETPVKKTNEADIIDCQYISIKDGVDFPKELGELQDGVSANEIRIVKQIVALQKGHKDVICATDGLMIEYYKAGEIDPSYIPLSKENLKKLYRLKEDKYNDFASKLEAKSHVAQYSVILEDDNGVKHTRKLGAKQRLDIKKEVDTNREFICEFELEGDGRIKQKIDVKSSDANQPDRFKVIDQQFVTIETLSGFSNSFQVKDGYNNVRIVKEVKATRDVTGGTKDRISIANGFMIEYSDNDGKLFYQNLTKENLGKICDSNVDGYYDEFLSDLNKISKGSEYVVKLKQEDKNKANDKNAKDFVDEKQLKNSIEIKGGRLYYPENDENKDKDRKLTINGVDYPKDFVPSNSPEPVEVQQISGPKSKQKGSSKNSPNPVML